MGVITKVFEGARPSIDTPPYFLFSYAAEAKCRKHRR